MFCRVHASPTRHKFHAIIVCAVEDKKVFFKFVEGEKGKVHSLPWTELLTLEELPFPDSADVSVGTKVLAPWYCDTELTVRHAEAVVVEGRGKGVAPGELYLFC